MKHLILILLITFYCKNNAIGQCIPKLIQNQTTSLSETECFCGLKVNNVKNKIADVFNVKTTDKIEISNTTINGNPSINKIATSSLIDITENTDIVSHQFSNTNIDFNASLCSNNSNIAPIVTHKICQLVYTLYKPTLSNCLSDVISLGGQLDAMIGGHFELFVLPYDANGVKLDKIEGYDANNNPIHMRGKWFIKLAGEDDFSSKDFSNYTIYQCRGQGISIVNDHITPHIADNGPNTYCKSKWNGAVVYYKIPAVGNRPEIRSNDLTYSMTRDCSTRGCGSECKEAILVNEIKPSDYITQCTYINNTIVLARYESNSNIDFETDVMIYPNPTNSIFHVSYKDYVELIYIELFAIDGQKILTGANDLDISHLNKGMYISFIHTNQGLFQKRFIIN